MRVNVIGGEMLKGRYREMTKAAPVLAILLCLLLAGPAARARRRSQTGTTPPEPAVVGRLCPTIRVEGPEAVGVPGIPINLAAKVSGAGPLTTLTCRWRVSAGTITSGAQSSVNVANGEAECTAVVDTTGVGRFTKVEATVEVGGLDRACSNRASGVTEVRGIVDPHPIDEYGGNLRSEDEHARLDNFAAELQSYPKLSGYIACYGGRRGRRGEAARLCARAKSYLVTRRQIDSDRLVSVDGGYREKASVVLWVLPPGVDFTPSPTVDPSGVKFTGAPTNRRRPRSRRD